MNTEGHMTMINTPRARGDVRDRTTSTRKIDATASHNNDVGLNHAEDGSAGVLSGHFRRSTSLDESDACRRRVALAVARAKQGDREALRYLYVQYADNVYGYIASILRDEHEAEDVTQHVFAKLMAVLPKYEQRAAPFTSWLLRLAHNAALDHLRRRLPTPAEEVRGPDERIDRGRSENVQVISHALAALPEDQRTVVVLRHLVGLTPGEIAERLGRTENSIHGLHHRGRRALQSHLRQLECAPVTAPSRVAA
jgi:RNA polymerase sigma-70 factor (ECF subfamily)